MILYAPETELVAVLQVFYSPVSTLVEKGNGLGGLGPEVPREDEGDPREPTRLSSKLTREE